MSNDMLARPTAPAAWRGVATQPRKSSSVLSNMAREIREHPLQTAALLTAAAVITNLAWSRSRRRRGGGIRTAP